ncbi:MAG: hypothetical protein RQ728_09310 [Brevefilum sp.]|nr:hypothetical protein [Brevefilum sp.]
MKNQPPSKWIVLCVFLILLFATLACGLDFGQSDETEDIRIQQTIVALQMTQAALEDQEPMVIEETPTEGPAPTPTPTMSAETPDVNFEGISFSYDQNIARTIIPGIIQGQNLGEEHMPGDTYPSYIEFSFDTYAVSDHFHDPKIRIYPVEEYRIINPSAANIIDELQQTLINKPGGGAMSKLPFLPMWNAAQMYSANVEYIDFQNGSGLRYLTMFGQAIYPIDNMNLFYTFQGITDDGRYYISAILPVIHGGLPNDGASLLEDYEGFIENWDNYLAESLTWLEEQTPQSFLPNLEDLDAMMSSFVITR